jgi:glycerol-3-phosphate dehydrogenase
MGEDTINKAVETAGLDRKPSRTRNLHLHGYATRVDRNNHLYVYGDEKEDIEKLMIEKPYFAERLDERLDFTRAEVVWAARYEMARTLEDVLARRIRALYLDARAAANMAPEAAKILARELGKDKKWEEAQVKQFTELAKRYYPEDN